MTLFFNRVDAVPISKNDFPYEFNQWLGILVDTLNEFIGIIQDALNLLKPQSYTSVQIAQLLSDGALKNGVLLYDSTLDVYVGMQAGSLVKFTTTPYP